MSHRPILGASGIFFQGDIPPIMQTILLTPMLAPNLQEPRRPGFGGAQAGDAIDHFRARLAAGHNLAVPFQFEHLRQARPVAGLIQQTTRGQSAGLDPAMPAIDGLSRAKISRGGAEAWHARLVVSEQLLNVLFELGLIVFDRPDIVAARRHNQQRQRPLRNRARRVGAATRARARGGGLNELASPFENGRRGPKSDGALFLPANDSIGIAEQWTKSVRIVT